MPPVVKTDEGTTLITKGSIEFKRTSENCPTIRSLAEMMSTGADGIDEGVVTVNCTAHTEPSLGRTLTKDTERLEVPILAENVGRVGHGTFDKNTVSLSLPDDKTLVGITLSKRGTLESKICKLNVAPLLIPVDRGNTVTTDKFVEPTGGRVNDSEVMEDDELITERSTALKPSISREMSEGP